MYITILVKQIYWYISQVSGERLQDHWSSGLPIFLKCLLVYIGFNLKCLLVYIFSAFYVKIYKIKSGFEQRGGTYVFL